MELNAGVILVNKERNYVLMVKDVNNQWRFPNDLIHIDESYINTSSRILYDEIGVQFNEKNIIKIITHKDECKSLTTKQLLNSVDNAIKLTTFNLPLNGEKLTSYYIYIIAESKMDLAININHSRISAVHWIPIRDLNKMNLNYNTKDLVNSVFKI